MMLLICLALHQQRQQTLGSTAGLEVVDLLLVMVVHKGLHRRNRGVNRAPTKQGRQSTRQPTGQTPGPQEPTSLRGWQPLRHLRQVVGFGRPMGLGKREQLGIAAPLRHSLNAFVNANSTRLTRMVRTQFAKKVSGQGVCHKFRSTGALCVKAWAWRLLQLTTTPSLAAGFTPNRRWGIDRSRHTLGLFTPHVLAASHF